ncbi:MAG: hypothetical protein WDO73_12630 [Ignavibacteriota bacterium]
MSLAKDHRGRMWVAAIGRGEFCLVDGQWQFVSVLKDHPDWTADRALADREDRIWLVYDALVAVLQDGAVRTYADKEGPDVGPIKVIKELEPYILIGGESGFIGIPSRPFSNRARVRREYIRVCDRLVVTADDGVWLAASPGIVHIGAG